MSLRSELASLQSAISVMLAALGDQPATQRTTAPAPAPSASPSSGRDGTVSINQEHLLQLVNMTRRFVRYSREGNIPSKEQRKYARRSIKAVKHLLPPRDTASPTR